MRVLIVSPTMGLGGAERLAVLYAEGLQRRGHEVTLAHGHRLTWFESRVDASVPVYRLTDLQLGPRSFATWRRELRALGRRLRPDVVFAQSVQAAAVAAAALPRVPRLVMLHGIPDEKERFAAYALRASRARALAVSDQTAAGIARHLGAPPIEVLRSGIDFAALERAADERVDGVPAGRPTFLYVGRFSHEKGTDVLVDAFARVVEAAPQARLICAGEGPELEARRAQAARLGIADRVAFLGAVPNVAPYVRTGDVFVLASRWEGLPLVLLESMGLGTPAVATAVEGVPLLVRDGETGWLVEPEDAEGLAARMLEAVSDPAELARRGAAAAELVRSEFSSERVLDRLDAVLREAVAGLPLRPRTVNRAIRGAERLAIRRARVGRTAVPGVRMLAYHRLRADTRDQLAVDPADFHRQLDAIAAAGAEVVSLADALALLRAPVERPYVCLTFDDGYRDFLDDPLPVLAERGLAATIFVATGIVDGVATYHWYRGSPPPPLSWDELAELRAGGLVAIESHTRTHPDLTRVDETIARDEIAGSKRILDERLPGETTVLSYPAGRFGPRDERLAREAGYAAAVGTGRGVNPGGTDDLFALRRTLVRPGLTVDDFRALLAGALDGRPPAAARTA